MFIEPFRRQGCNTHTAGLDDRLVFRILTQLDEDKLEDPQEKHSIRRCVFSDFATGW